MALNGRLPLSTLTKTVIGGRLRDDAAASADRLAYAFYKHFGRPLQATDTYRDYDTQVYLKKIKGPYAAAPGTSNHGWGVAVDFASNINNDKSAEHRWMEKNAGAYGWENPLWARNSTTADGMYEPWHWEYSPARDRKKSAPAVRVPAAGEIGFGQSGSKVREVQELLKARGYKNIVIDGKFGMGTGAAVVSFQKKRKLAQVGVVGPKTLAELKNQKKPNPVTGPKKRAPKKLATLRQGSKGREVNILQVAVGAKVDGIFGAGTAQKVVAFQRKHGLVPDGIVGPRTWQAVLDGTYQVGSKNNDVKVLQLILGFTGKNVDGIFGAGTKTRLIELQRYLGVAADGVFGSDTRGALQRRWK
jgi:peptidoglycan hydrolase-like protein with peptidoglycan-binding domain